MKKALKANDYVRYGSGRYDHRRKAEEMLGRPLKRTEVVHHIDGDPKNNSLSNLMVMRSAADHTRIHCGGVARKNLDGSYSVSQNVEEKECLYCGEIFTGTPSSQETRKYCSPQCASNARVTEEKPNEEELREELVKGSFVSVGKKHGVSDNGVRKWCKSYGMSTRAKDYSEVA